MGSVSEPALLHLAFPRGAVDKAYASPYHYDSPPEVESLPERATALNKQTNKRNKNKNSLRHNYSVDLSREAPL